MLTRIVSLNSLSHDRARSISTLKVLAFGGNRSCHVARSKPQCTTQGGQCRNNDCNDDLNDQFSFVTHNLHYRSNPESGTKVLLFP